MNNERFNQILEEQINRCWSILSEKEKEYAVSGDRLHNFKVASDLGQTTMKNALAGMMIKHTVSVYDMCFDDHKFSKEIWEEKITDHINYLLILRALIEQEDLTNERVKLFADDKLISELNSKSYEEDVIFRKVDGLMYRRSVGDDNWVHVVLSEDGDYVPYSEQCTFDHLKKY